MPIQDSLFAYANPLLERFGEAFFKQIPTAPGVYFLRGANGDILYVGKAKNLRVRLNSYKRARPSVVSRKVLRMLKMTRSIAFELCENETQALLAENQLLRKHRPHFNVLNTNPESYYFLGLELVQPGFVQLHLTNNRASVKKNSAQKNKIKFFGVFRNRRSVRSAFSALLRLLSAVNAVDEGFYYPSVLVKERPPRKFVLPLKKTMHRELELFLSGRSKKFLETLTQQLLENLCIPRFIHRVISEDLKILEQFYARGPKKILKLKRQHGIRRRPIAQDEIDDLLVLSN